MPKKHGRSAAYLGYFDRTYQIWLRMRKRCNTRTCLDYPDYGGRGIQVCERWNDFGNFLADMGDAPDGMSIDRVDNDGNYEPGNCAWATAQEQANNRRSNTRLELDGRTQTLMQWSRETGLNRTTISQRLVYGWSVEQALTTPVFNSQKEGARWQTQAS